MLSVTANFPNKGEIYVKAFILVIIVLAALRSVSNKKMLQIRSNVSWRRGGVVVVVWLMYIFIYKQKSFHQSEINT